jgi:hypothetical protein
VFLDVSDECIDEEGEFFALVWLHSWVEVCNTAGALVGAAVF